MWCHSKKGFVQEVLLRLSVVTRYVHILFLLQRIPLLRRIICLFPCGTTWSQYLSRKVDTHVKLVGERFRFGSSPKTQCSYPLRTCIIFVAAYYMSVSIVYVLFLLGRNISVSKAIWLRYVLSNYGAWILSGFLLPFLNGIISPCSADHSNSTKKKGVNKTEKNSVLHEVFRSWSFLYQPSLFLTISAYFISRRHRQFIAMKLSRSSKEKITF